MPRGGFEPMIPEFERAKTVHTLDRAATVTSFRSFWLSVNTYDVGIIGHFVLN
jgi:hypothetical protein